jgi:hypothetical protein
MSAPIIVPFDNNPASVLVITSSYTVPSGKFARVYAEAENGGGFFINGGLAVSTAAILNIDLFSASPQSYTVPSGYRAKVSSIGSVNTPVIVNGNQQQNIASNVYSEQYEVGPGGVVSHGNVGIASYGLQGVAIPGNATNRSATFFVPSGTVLSGSGSWRATVMLYNVLS